MFFALVQGLLSMSKTFFKTSWWLTLPSLLRRAICTSSPKSFRFWCLVICNFADVISPVFLRDFLLSKKSQKKSDLRLLLDINDIIKFIIEVTSFTVGVSRLSWTTATLCFGDRGASRVEKSSTPLPYFEIISLIVFLISI